MKINIILTVILFGQLWALNSCAQNLRPLSIGDTIPDIMLNSIIHHKDSSGKLSQLTKGKNLILDFFATWCQPCVKALPEFQAIQKKFSNDLAIIPVTYENRSFILDWLKKRPEFDSSLKYVTNSTETALSKLFVHKLIPHEIWIDKKGVIKAITNGNYVTDSIVQRFVTGQPLRLPLKKDDMELNMKKPLLINGNGGPDTNYLNRSILTRSVPGSGGRAHFDRVKDKASRIMVTYLPALQLFYMAYTKFEFSGYNRNRVIMDLKDSIPYIVPKNKLEYDNWYNKNAFGYELKVNKPLPIDQFFSYMLDDLNRYFDIKGSIVKRERSCYVLYRINNDDSLLRTRSVEKIPAHTGKIRNMPISNLVNHLNYYKNIETVIDETEFVGNIDMDLDFKKITDIRSYPQIDVINKTLIKYGLAIKKENRIVDVLLIQDKTKSNL